MRLPYEWSKVFVYPDDMGRYEKCGDATQCDERLHAVLQNYLFMTGQSLSVALRYVTVYKQHNRDIYYLIAGQLDDIRSLDPEHLDQWECDNIIETTINEVIGRCHKLPSWWHSDFIIDKPQHRVGAA